MGSFKTALARNLCRPVVGRTLALAFGGRVPSLRFRGMRFDTRSPSITPEIVAMIFWGIYESAERRFVERYLRPDLDVIELGSSLGAVSCTVARRLEPGSRLVCVEANPDLVPVLEKNLADNGAGHARVLHRALSYDGPTARLVRARRSISGRVSEDAAGDAVVVPAGTLSQLLAEGGIEGDYALVSDVEGAELGFIDGDAEALARCRQIVAELHACGPASAPVAVDELVRRLVDRHGFTLRDRYGPVCVFDRAG